MRILQSVSGKRLMAFMLSLILFAAVFVCDIPSSFAEEPPAESPTAAPSETATPEPTEASTETPAPSEEPTETPAPSEEPVDDHLSPMPDDLTTRPDGYQLPDSATAPDAMMVPFAASGDFEYAINSDGISVTITKYIGIGGDVTIPSSIHSKTVTAIGTGAFSGVDLKSVLIPSCITIIGDSSFSNCGHLERAEIPEGVASIGDYAFSGTALTTVTIPSSVTSIGNSVFILCQYLKDVNVSSANANYTSLNGVLFNKAMSRILVYPNGKTDTSYIIPSSVTEIADNAFSMCFQYLKKVTIPNGVTSIGKGAFENCQLISTITLPNSVTTIGENAFNTCIALMGINIPPSVTKINKRVFFGCRSLTGVEMPDGITEIGEEAFAYCESILTVIIPAAITTINDGAFANCDDLYNISFYGNAPTISYSAFFECSSDLEIWFDKTKSGYAASINGHPTVAQDAAALPTRDFSAHSVSTADFEYWVGNGYAAVGGYKGSGSSVIVPSQCEGYPVINIADLTFYRNSTLSSVVIPDGVCRIGSGAFQLCEHLTSISLPSSVYRIGRSAFSSCTGLKSIQLPASLGIIEANTFYNCRSLNQVSMPADLVCIENYAFERCDRLKYIDIPNSVLFIDNYAFYSSGLLRAFFFGNAPYTDENTRGIFAECPPDFTVCYINGARGFTNPWLGYPTKTFDPKASYTVAFDSRGGTPVASVTGGYYLYAPEPPVPVRTGYRFGGWYPNLEFKFEEVLTFPLPADSNKTVYAKWYPNPCWISYINTGNTRMDPVIMDYGTVIEKAPIPVSNNMIFAGWYPSFAYNTPPISFPYTVTGDAVFFAKWQKSGPYLSDISISAGHLSRGFDQLATKYTVTLGENESSVTITASHYAGTSMTINGKAVSSTTVALANGKSKMVTIKAKYGRKSTTYKITVVRAKSGDNNLAMITNTAGTMNQPFNPNVTNYTLSLNQGTKSVTIKAIKSNAMAKVSPASKKLTLKNGQTKVIKFTVKAQSGAKKVYTVTVTRAP